MPQSLSKTLVHIVFSTKHRQELIDDDIEAALFGYIGATCNSLKCTTIVVGGYRNHVHILCSLYRPLSQSDLVKKIKTSSSRWINTQGPAYEHFYWQDGYGIFSVSQLQVGGLIRYINNQRAHHESKIYKEEYRRLLREHELEYDEDHVWD